MTRELRLLKIRGLIAQLEAVTAQANHQTAREGWTCDWSLAMNDLTRQIEWDIAALAKLDEVRPL